MKASSSPILAGALLAAVLSLSCAGAPEERPAPLPGTLSGPRLELALEPGPHYARKMDYVLFSYTVWPQVAVWLERTDGSFVGTLYVTEVVVKGDYQAAPKEGRPEALPVWSALVARAGERVDAVSSPTTVGAELRYGSGLVASLPPGRYVVKLETNRSYDWNATYTQKNSGVNGQPSLVYAAGLEIGGPEAALRFQPIGVGSVDGSDGEIRHGLEGIDTALELFSSLTATYRPE